MKKIKQIFSAVLFVIGFVLMWFFPGATIFLFGTEAVYSAADSILGIIHKDEDVWLEKSYLIVNLILLAINILILIF